MVCFLLCISEVFQICFWAWFSICFILLSTYSCVVLDIVYDVTVSILSELTICCIREKVCWVRKNWLQSLCSLDLSYRCLNSFGSPMFDLCYLSPCLFYLQLLLLLNILFIRPCLAILYLFSLWLGRRR